MVGFCRNDRNPSNSRKKHLLCSRMIICSTPAGRRAILSKKKAWQGKKSIKELWASSKMSSFSTASGCLNRQQNNITKLPTVHTYSLTFLIVLGRYLKVHAACFCSLALQREAISAGHNWPPQKPRLYLQRASSQRAISMRKHSHKSTMEYMSWQ